jgi:hypothetical protein
MKTLISDKELVAYISGQLSSEDTRKLHEKAAINGETDLLLHAQLASLACQEELADELLGEDDFMTDKKNSSNYHWTIAAKDISKNSNK